MKQKVKSLLPQDSNFLKSRNIKELSSNLENESIDLIIYDLQNPKLKIKEVANLINTNNMSDKTVCFFSHIFKELETEATELGFKKIYPRSRFFSHFKNILTEVVN